ncbi:MAG: hypothetical protein JSR61_21500 [Proteobacteria bacterium]|nr:hypothetical protein [Pseudomonadota bacterium]
MIVESLVGLSLVLNASLESRSAFAATPPVVPEISTRQKEMAFLPLVNRATDCIVRRVFADPRYGRAQPAEINDLIIDSIPACAAPVRAMIEAHDRLYGRGSGEAFLLGPYLDVLPAAIVKQAGVKSP